MFVIILVLSTFLIVIIITVCPGSKENKKGKRDEYIAELEKWLLKEYAKGNPRKIKCFQARIEEALPEFKIWLSKNKKK